MNSLRFIFLLFLCAFFSMSVMATEKKPPEISDKELETLIINYHKEFFDKKYYISKIEKMKRGKHKGNLLDISVKYTYTQTSNNKTGQDQRIFTAKYYGAWNIINMGSHMSAYFSDPKKDNSRQAFGVTIEDSLNPSIQKKKPHKRVTTCVRTKYYNLTQNQIAALKYASKSALRKVVGGYCIDSLKALSKVPFKGNTLIKYEYILLYPNGYKAKCLAPKPKDFWSRYDRDSECNSLTYLSTGKPIEIGGKRKFIGETEI